MDRAQIPKTESNGKEHQQPSDRDTSLWQVYIGLICTISTFHASANPVLCASLTSTCRHLYINDLLPCIPLRQCIP